MAIKSGEKENWSEETCAMAIKSGAKKADKMDTGHARRPAPWR
jgi:hypothetical protein